MTTLTVDWLLLPAAGSVLFQQQDFSVHDQIHAKCHDFASKGDSLSPKFTEGVRGIFQNDTQPGFTAKLYSTVDGFRHFTMKRPSTYSARKYEGRLVRWAESCSLAPRFEPKKAKIDLVIACCSGRSSSKGYLEQAANHDWHCYGKWVMWLNLSTGVVECWRSLWRRPEGSSPRRLSVHEVFPKFKCCFRVLAPECCNSINMFRNNFRKLSLRDHCRRLYADFRYAQQCNIQSAMVIKVGTFEIELLVLWKIRVGNELTSSTVAQWSEKF